MKYQPSILQSRTCFRPSNASRATHILSSGTCLTETSLDSTPKFYQTVVDNITPSLTSRLAGCRQCQGWTTFNRTIEHLSKGHAAQLRAMLQQDLFVGGTPTPDGHTKQLILKLPTQQSAGDLRCAGNGGKARQAAHFCGTAGMEKLPTTSNKQHRVTRSTWSVNKPAHCAIKDRWQQTPRGECEDRRNAKYMVTQQFRTQETLVRHAHHLEHAITR